MNERREGQQEVVWVASDKKILYTVDTNKYRNTKWLRREITRIIEAVFRRLRRASTNLARDYKTYL